ncbi:MAG TPA: metalloregulator ArsR/SmtB family transcription factor [Acidimicrobiales bacterium]
MATDVLTVLRALAEPTRLRVFCALRDKERCVSDLVNTEGLSQPLVSHHLRALAEAGLVTSRRLDGFTMYSVDPDGLASAKAATDQLLDPDALAPTAQPGGNPGCCRG